ncbi:MAG TPA: hypothetical protein PLD54_02630 [Candidatus Levybacteria bacterium]|nr:hypothetical protein [Candidatus Levybacteria bacterium]
MKERIIIVFVAVIIGLVLTTVGYLLYQSFDTPATPSPNEQVQNPTQPVTTSPTPDKSFFITVTEPQPESITNKRTITVTGTTNPGNTVVISSNQDDVVAQPKDDGTFSTTITINAGTNVLVARAVNAQGDSVEETRIVTFVSEDF